MAVKSLKIMNMVIGRLLAKQAYFGGAGARVEHP